MLLLLLLFADPPQATVLLKQGLIALQRGDLVIARQDFEQACAADPRNPYIWSSLAETYLRLDDHARAIAVAKEAENLSAGNAVAGHALAIFYFHYADDLLHREKFTEAADLLAGALQHHPGDAQLTLALGVARYGQRRFEDSIVAFLAVIDADPSIEQPYIFLGKMLDQAGAQLDVITQAFRAWAEKNPENAQAQLLLAKALLASDPQDARAATFLNRSIALDGNQWESHYQLGLFLAGKHDYRAAAVELNRSIELDPKQPLPHYHLARVYDRLGEADRAKTEREIHLQLTASHTP